MTFISICILVLVLYFLPTFIAWKGKAAPAMIIFLLNLFLGWTVIGWLFALFMSLINTTIKNVFGLLIGIALLSCAIIFFGLMGV